MPKKEKKIRIPHAGISKKAMSTEIWRNFSPVAKAIYLELKKKYCGPKTGSIELSYRELKKHRGLKNNQTIKKGFDQLITAGWLEMNGVGGIFKGASKYRLPLGSEDKTNILGEGGINTPQGSKYEKKKGR